MNEQGNPGPVGPPGAQAVTQGLEHAIEWASGYFGVKKEQILIGFREEPPNVEGFELYIYYNGSSAEYWRKRQSRWVNWCYQQ